MSRTRKPLALRPDPDPGQSVPSTAMAAKGGYAELTVAQVRDAVDYMLARAGFRDAAPVKPAAAPSLPTILR